jgi:hypothetical protein
MKKTTTDDPNDLLVEYDLASMAGGVRGKYHSQYRAGVNLALLEPDLARALPTDAAVNDALRKAEPRRSARGERSARRR